MDPTKPKASIAPALPIRTGTHGVLVDADGVPVNWQYTVRACNAYPDLQAQADAYEMYLRRCIVIGGQMMAQADALAEACNAVDEWWLEEDRLVEVADYAFSDGGMDAAMIALANHRKEGLRVVQDNLGSALDNYRKLREEK